MMEVQIKLWGDCMIVRGATQVHKIYVPFQSEEIGAIYIIYKQNGKIITEKSKEDIEFDDDSNMASIHFSQRDTLAFEPYTTLNSDVVDVMGRIVLTDGSAYGTTKWKERVVDTGKEGVIMIDGTVEEL